MAGVKRRYPSPISLKRRHRRWNLGLLNDGASKPLCELPDACNLFALMTLPMA